MSRKPWLRADQGNAADSAQASVNSPKLLQTLEQVRLGIADVAQSRERVQEQMNILTQRQAKLEWQAGEARRVGREDLAQEALSRAEAVQGQFSELATSVNWMKAEEQRLIEGAQQLQARIDGFTGIPGQHSNAAVGHLMPSDTPLIPPGSAWRVDAETIMCALLPHVRGMWPKAPNVGWWTVQPPIGGTTRVRAEALGPGYMVCLGSIQALDEVGRNEGTLSGMFGQLLGAAAVNYMESRKLAAPMASFRHYGQAGEPVYFGFASNKHAREFSPEQLLYVRPGQWHGPCPQHSTDPFLEMAASLRVFMKHLWVHAGGSNLGHLSTTMLAINEADFMTAVAEDVPFDMLPDVGRIAEYAGLIAFRRHDSGMVETGLTPAGAVWYLANQRLVGDELIGNAMPKQNFTIRTGDSSVVQVGSQGCSAQVSGDHYTSGTVGAQGPGSKATVFGWLPSGSSTEDLRLQLKSLRTILCERSSVGDETSIYAIGEAELAAADGDEKRLMLALRKAGRWALAAAQEVGLQVAAAALAKATGAG